MHQRFANQSYPQMRTLHLPDLATLEWLRGLSARLHRVLHGHKPSRTSVGAEQIVCMSPPRVHGPCRPGIAAATRALTWLRSHRHGMSRIRWSPVLKIPMPGSTPVGSENSAVI